LVFAKRLKKLEAAMDEATSYDEWQQAAIAHDEESGAARWRRIDRSTRYDFVSIRARLDHLRNMRARQDDVGLLFALNEGIHGNMGGMGSAPLYGKAKFGTKTLIEDYVEEIALALEHLADPATDSISFEDKLDFFQRASHCFGRSALMMSGSGTLLYFHLGVARALWQERLLPDIISGSSGGALVGSVICSSRDEELDELLKPDILPGLDDPTGLIRRFVSIFKTERLTVDDVWAMLEEFLPDYTFEESFRRTGRHMNVSVAPAENHQKSRLLNADTSPNVFMREAVLASTAIPGFFPAVILMAKNDKGERQEYHSSRKWVDGSLSDDLPAKRLARLYGVNHYIVSQTNPYIIPFIDTTKRKTDTVSELKYALIDTARTWINASLIRHSRLSIRVMSGISQLPRSKRFTTLLGRCHGARMKKLPTSWTRVSALPGRVSSAFASRRVSAERSILSCTGTKNFTSRNSASRGERESRAARLQRGEKRVESLRRLHRYPP
jgi:NTE family protein